VTPELQRPQSTPVAAWSGAATVLHPSAFHQALLSIVIQSATHPRRLLSPSSMPALALSRAPAACVRSQRSGSSSTGRASASRPQGSALQAQRQTARRAAARRLCTASAGEKEGTQQTEGQPKVPDTPPAPTGASRQQQEQAAARAQPVQVLPQWRPQCSWRVWSAA
jgi:hypothetical protein